MTDAEVDLLTNEFAHLPLQRPVHDKFDCVWVTIAKLLKDSIVNVAFRVSVMRPHPKTRGVMEYDIVTMLKDLQVPSG